MPNPSRKNYGTREKYEAGDIVRIWGFGKDLWMVKKAETFQNMYMKESTTRYLLVNAWGRRTSESPKELRLATKKEAADWDRQQSNAVKYKKETAEKNRAFREEEREQFAVVMEAAEKFGVPPSSEFWQILRDNSSGATKFMNEKIWGGPRTVKGPKQRLDPSRLPP